MMRILYFMLRAITLYIYIWNIYIIKLAASLSNCRSYTFCSVEQSSFFTNKFTISPYTYTIAVSFVHLSLSLQMNNNKRLEEVSLSLQQE